MTSSIPDRGQVTVRRDGHSGNAHRGKVVAFITDSRAVDRTTDHLKLTFVAEKPPPGHVFRPVVLMAAGARTDDFLENGEIRAAQISKFLGPSGNLRPDADNAGSMKP